MTTLTLETDPVVVDINFFENRFVLSLEDGRSLSIPLTWYPRLMQATKNERENWIILGDGYAIEWPDLDEHIGVEGLLAGKRSGESQKSFEKWLSTR
jgi:hypothetical protein